MNIITLITKRSVREILKEKIFLKFYTSHNFPPGSVIEIIEGNKKALAIVIKNEDIRNFKQALRSKEIEIKKLKLSKTGKNSNGKIITDFTSEEIKNKKKVNEKIANFFPKKRNKNKNQVLQEAGLPEKFNLKNISVDKYKNRKRTYYNETQELVDIIRKHFGEKVVRGIGSFSYYLGFFKKIPNSEIKQFFAEAKQSRKPIDIQKRIF